MFAYWEHLLEPLLRTLQPRSIVEIGAYGGENSRNLLTQLPPDGTLHVIDPAPVADLERLDPRVRLYRELSLDALPRIGPFDAAIIDGDHNWYTVFHELKAIEGLYADTPDAFPLLIFHDTGWPYGRRDMYHAPETIPDRHRLPYAELGMVPGESALAGDAGLNPSVSNALHEGGERNGVLTAIEDFIAESPLAFTFRTLPPYFGYGFLLGEAFARRRPEVKEALLGLFEPARLIALLERQEERWVHQLLAAEEAQRRLEGLSRRYEALEKRHPPGPAERPAAGAVELSIVVVVYNMRREARRTLHSLTRGYQHHIDDLTYEVIVVDNGSSDPLIKEEVEALGEQFRYHYLPDAPTSPARAINFGVGQAEGEFVALMIDGAHILTPGLLHYARRALHLYREPVVVPTYWFIGPGNQWVLAERGWDQADEDALFERIDWPANGYELFLAGEEIRGRDSWLHALFESNCLFMRKTLFEAIGGADERFDAPGGGFLNADLYREAAELGGTRVVAILGEATFHQFHGGTTTNVPRVELERLVEEYREQYRRIRGKGYALPKVHIEYVGHMPLETRQAGRVVEPLREKYHH